MRRGQLGQERRSADPGGRAGGRVCSSRRVSRRYEKVREVPADTLDAVECAHPLKGDRRRLRIQRSAARRRPRHRRHRHRLCPHRARPWPRGLRGLDVQCARAGEPRHQHHHPLHRRRERRLHRSRAGLHRQARHQRQGREGRRQRGRDQGAGRARHAAGARPAQASVPAFLALEEAGDLPQHAAMVHRDGQGHRGQRQGKARRHPARPRHARDLGDAMGAAGGAKPHQRHDRQQARLGDLAAARLGRADRGVRAREGRRLRRNPAGRSWSTSASPKPSWQEGADAWYMDGARDRFLGSRAGEDWKKVDDICDVWFDSGSTHAFVLEDRRAFSAASAISSARSMAAPIP